MRKQHLMILILMPMIAVSSLCAATPKIRDSPQQAGPRSSINATAFEAAKDSDRSTSGRRNGHYEWHSEIGHGPRSPLVATRRVWVPDT